jgi:hypothetical protein
MDAKVALAWISSDSKRYEPFVSRRISEIQNTCDEKDSKIGMSPGIMWLGRKTLLIS